MENRLADTAGLLAFFHDKFDAKNASDEELEFLSRAGEEASSAAYELDDILSGLANLICEDEEKGNCGAFRTKTELPKLLWMISSRARAIGQQAYIASESGFVLRERYRACAETLVKAYETSDRVVAARAAAAKTQRSHVTTQETESEAV